MNPFASARRAVRATLTALERATHSLRRRRASARIRALEPASFLFVCHGNICRSPYAAVAMARLQPGVVVASAGFIGPGRPSPDTAIKVAAQRGLDLSAHRSQVITRELARTAGVVVVMDSAQARGVSVITGVPASRILVLGDLDPGPIERRAIADPVEQPASAFEACYERIDRCLGELAAVARRH